MLSGSQGRRRPARTVAPARAWAIALVLAALSTCAFLDRQVLALLAPDLIRTFAVSDVQIGVLLGPAFIVPYNILLLPVAFVADRADRRKLIVIGAVVWTGMTIASAFAQTFTALLILRGGVALGEACLGPAAISLLGDLFAREQRPLPTATYIAGSVVGNMGSPMFSAAILHWARAIGGSTGSYWPSEPWRLTLIGVGLPGLALALLLAVIGREPPRPDRAAQDDGGEPFWHHMRSHGAVYAGAFLGLGLLGMVGTALGLWGPSFAIRAFALDQVAAGYYLGLSFLAAGIAGTLCLPALLRQRLRSGRADQIVPITIATILLLVAGAVLGGWSSSFPVTLVGFSVAMFMLTGVGTLPTLLVQLYAPSHLRGRVTALLFFVIYLLSSGVGPVVVPWLASRLFGSASAALGGAIAIVSMIAGLGAIIAFAAIHRPLCRAEANAPEQSA